MLKKNLCNYMENNKHKFYWAARESQMSKRKTCKFRRIKPIK